MRIESSGVPGKRNGAELTLGRPFWAGESKTVGGFAIGSAGGGVGGISTKFPESLAKLSVEKKMSVVKAKIVRDILELGQRIFWRQMY